MVVLYFIIGAVIFLALMILIIACCVQSNSVTMHELFNEEMYGYKFLEDRFPPVKNEAEYMRDVKRGYEICHDKTLVVSGLAYNLGRNSSKMLIKRLDYLASVFKRVELVIYAADSKDDTMKHLRDAMKHCHYIKKLHLPEDEIDKTGCNRFLKMAKLRNVLIKHCRKIKTDYIMMIDCDMSGPTSKDGIAHSIRLMHEEEYGMVAANGLRNESSFDCVFSYLGYVYYDPIAAILEDGTEITLLNLFTLWRGERLIRVQSAFCGAAIYDKRIIDQFDYDEHGEFCEHKTLNLKAWKDGEKMAINPNFILLSGVQGSAHKKDVKNK